MMPFISDDVAKAGRAAPESQESVALAARLEKVTTAATSVYEKAAAYDNAIIIAGYAAFFAIWSGVADQLPRAAALISAASLTFSLTLYVAFHILQMVMRSVAQRSQLKLLQLELTPEEFSERWDAAAQDIQRATAKVLVIWPFVLIPCIVSGLLAACLTGFNALALALGFAGWPQ